MKFKWIDRDSDIGYYELILYNDEGEQTDEIWFKDYSCDFNLNYDKERGYKRRYAYEIGYCNGFSMHCGFDEDENFYHRACGGYQGNKQHTIEDVKRWCENYIAQQYISDYYAALKALPKKEKMCKWFEGQGFKLENSL